jgi:hypothetical protein
MGNDNIVHCINSIFYQTFEYIIAPMFLVIIVHFVKETKNDFKGLERNTIEYLFVSLYSTLLFFLSMMAHHVHMKECTCSDMRLTLLLVFIFGMMILFIQKRIVQANWKPNLLVFILDRMWIIVMLILLCIIVHLNIHINELEYSTSNTPETFWLILHYIFSLPQFPFSVGFIVVISITIYAWKTENALAVDVFQNMNLSIDDQNGLSLLSGNDIRLFKKVAKSYSIKKIFKYKACLRLAKHYFESDEIDTSTSFVNQAKAIGFSEGYEEMILLPVRELIIRLQKINGNIVLAEKEVKEVEAKLPLPTDRKYKSIKYCYDTLTSLLNDSN